MKHFLKFLDSLIYVFAVVSVSAVLWLVLTGCGTTPIASPETHINRQFDSLKKEIADRIIVEQKTSPVVQEKSSSTIQTPVQSVPENSKTEQKKQDIGGIVLEYANWIYFAVLCIVSLIGGWYFKRTGKKSETLQKIEETVNRRLPWKQRIVFKILKWIYRNRKKKGK